MARAKAGTWEHSTIEASFSKGGRRGAGGMALIISWSYPQTELAVLFISSKTKQTRDFSELPSGGVKDGVVPIRQETTKKNSLIFQSRQKSKELDFKN